MTQGVPPAGPGQAIGLFGGSFDPPHAGHVHVTQQAMARFGLDRVWWLVSPGNPLKAHGPAPLSRRMAAARKMMRHPRVSISDLETQIGTQYTAETLEWLLARHQGVRFVWLMGADNLAQFHRWERWEWIMRSLPIGVIARPGQRLPARTGRAASRFEAARLPASASHLLPSRPAPAWCFVNVPMMAVSSSEIRARGDWTHPPKPNA